MPIDITFGQNRPASLQEVDPWDGLDAPEVDARVRVPGLGPAVRDSRNWSGSAPPAGFNVVTLVASNDATNTPIDPLGPATLRQKVCPLEVTLQKFGEYKPKTHNHFNFTSGTINPSSGSGADNAIATFGPTDVKYVMEDFVPGHFQELSNDKKLSKDSYLPMKAGFTIAPDALTLGSQGHQELKYTTVYIKDTQERVADSATYSPTDKELQGMLARCASALGGILRSGTNKYMLQGRPKRVSLGEKKYVVADTCTNVTNTTLTPTAVPRIDAEQALLDYLQQNPQERNRYVILPKAA